jgi:hypothetical protein
MPALSKEAIYSIGGGDIAAAFPGVHRNPEFWQIVNEAGPGTVTVEYDGEVVASMHKNGGDARVQEPLNYMLFIEGDGVSQHTSGQMFRIAEIARYTRIRDLHGGEWGRDMTHVLIGNASKSMAALVRELPETYARKEWLAKRLCEDVLNTLEGAVPEEPVYSD